MRRLAFLLVLLSASPAAADIWSYTDANGVIHFTNIEPSGAHRRKWKRTYKTGPGKASAIRGSGCPKCDVVPARDRSPERYTRYDAYIKEAAALYQIPEALIRAVIKVESDYDPRVVSWAGARGLMQLMPATWKDMGVSDPHEPRQNILGGTRYLRILANKFEGDIVRVLAAYENTGKYVKNVLRHFQRYRQKGLASR